MIEQHYTVNEIAERWGLHRTTITKLFQDRAGVMKLEKNGLLRRKHEKRYVTLRIPESVMKQVYLELTKK